MSKENVEIVRRLYEVAGGRLDRGVGFLASEIELHLSGVFLILTRIPRAPGRPRVC